MTRVPSIRRARDDPRLGAEGRAGRGDPADRRLLPVEEGRAKSVSGGELCRVERAGDSASRPKVDCDTYVGTRDGVPRLLEIFARARDPRDVLLHVRPGPIRASPSRRVFTKPGFLEEDAREPRRLALRLSDGALRDAPAGAADRRALRRRDPRRRRGGARDGRPRLGPRRLARRPRPDDRPKRSARRWRRAHDEYRAIFGRPARAAAAAGWTVNARSLAVEEERSCSTPRTRAAAGRSFRRRRAGASGRSRSRRRCRRSTRRSRGRSSRHDDDQRALLPGGAPRGPEVHTLHAEVEGRSKAAALRSDPRRLDGGRASSFSAAGRPRAGDPARVREEIPVREIVRTTLPGRGGTVATGWPRAAD